jgi:hypothetical protein
MERGQEEDGGTVLWQNRRMRGAIHYMQNHHVWGAFGNKQNHYEWGAASGGSDG